MKRNSVMNYEQKYKEALERAQKELQTCGSTDCDAAKQIFRFFPELKDSEDEKIRKELKRAIDVALDYSYFDKETADGCLAWLEKQGEPIDDNIITRDDEILQAISIGLTDALENFGWSDFGGLPIEEIQEWLEKQGEQTI